MATNCVVVMLDKCEDEGYSEPEVSAVSKGFSWAFDAFVVTWYVVWNPVM